MKYVDFYRPISHFSEMDKNQSFVQLEKYIREHMRMSHVYQPVMLRVLLENGGAAAVEDVAKALLNYDRSQIEYYEIRVKNMVGKVLTKNGIVEPVKDGRRIIGYRLTTDQLTNRESSSLMDLCDKRLSAYVKKRGESIWGHRGIAEGYVPGSIRYDVLKRAKYRCELCGAHEDQIALHIDHIVPRAQGGIDDISNFQALCITCNTNKCDRDDTDFRGVLASYNDRADGCMFCNIDSKKVVAQNELCYAIRDGYPVTRHHTLVIPKRHVAGYFDLYQPELNAIHAMLEKQRTEILCKDPTVTGSNVGINAGEDAGQTIFHVHVHLIPRRKGDVSEPRGGVRGVIPSKQQY